MMMSSGTTVAAVVKSNGSTKANPLWQVPVEGLNHWVAPAPQSPAPTPGLAEGRNGTSTVWVAVARTAPRAGVGPVRSAA